MGLNNVAEQAERKTGDKETQQMDMFKEDVKEGAGCRRLRKRTVASWTRSASKKPEADGLKLQVGKRRTVADHRERLENRSVD